MSKRINLTKVNGCYSKELREACNNIKILLKDPLTDTETMRDFISKVIEPAFIEAEAKQRFRTNLASCKSKQEIDQLCTDVVLHGMYYLPRKKVAK